MESYASFKNGNSEVLLDEEGFRINYTQNGTSSNICRALIENNKDPIIIINPEGIIESANLAATELWQTQSENLVNTHYLKVLKLPPNEERNHEIIFHKPYVFQLDFLDEQKRKSYYEVKATPVWEKGELVFVILVFSNTTELIKLKAMYEKLKIAEQAWQENTDKYRLITEKMTDLVTVINENREISYTSPSRAHILGFLPSEVIGHSIYEYVHPDDYEEFKEFVDDLFLTQGKGTLEFRYKHTEESWVWMEAKGTFFINDDDDDDENFLLFVSRDIEEKKEMRDKLKLMAFQDELTGLPNRRAFHEEMHQILEEATTKNEKCALLYLDIDNFKDVNDKMGHLVGDQLLKQFSKRVISVLRSSDMLARQSGDEFLVLLPDIEDKKDAKRVAIRILKRLQEEWHIENYTFTTTSSIGISVFPNNGRSMKELLSCADQALYVAKESGKNQWIMCG